MIRSVRAYFKIGGAYGDPINDVLYDKFYDISYQGELIPRLCTSYETETDDQGPLQEGASAKYTGSGLR